MSPPFPDVASMMVNGILHPAYYQHTINQATENLELTVTEIATQFGFGNSRSFRSYLQRGNAIAIGSQAQRAVLREHFLRNRITSNNLNVVAPYSWDNSLNLTCFLPYLGWRKAVGPEQPPLLDEDGNNNVHDVERWFHSDGERSIEFIFTNTNEPNQFVPTLPTTADMVYIQPFGAVALYAVLTLNLKGLINSDTSLTAGAVEKQTARGMKVDINPVPLNDPPCLHICRRNLICPHTIRTNMDRGVLFVPFQDCESLLRDLSFAEETIAWKLHNNTCHGEASGFVISIDDVRIKMAGPPVDVPP